MDLVGMTELPDIGLLKYWKTSTADHFRPNQEFSGCVDFVSAKSIFLRGVWAKFTGFNILHSDDGNEDILQKVDLLLGEEDHYLGGLHDVLFGFGEEEGDNVIPGGGAMLELHAGSHKWNFSFKIPEKAPFSYCDKNVEVIYSVTVFLDTPEVPAAMSQISHTIIVGCAAGTPIPSSCRGDYDTLVLAPTEKLRLPPNILGNGQKEIFSVMPRPGLFQCFSSTPAVTLMRLTVPSSGDPSPAVFAFEYLRTKLEVRCSFETNRTGQPLRIEARLLTCVNTRRDSSKSFQTTRELLESTGYASNSAVKSKAMAKKNRVADGGSCKSIWHSSVTLDSPQRQNTLDFDVPIAIDPTARASCLAEWPRAAALPHDSRNRILNFTASGPLFEYKVALVVSVYTAVKGGKSRLLFPPCIGEILVRPPVQLAAVLGAVSSESPLAATIPPIPVIGSDTAATQQVAGVPRIDTPARARGRNAFNGPRAPDQPLRHPPVDRRVSAALSADPNPGIAARGDNTALVLASVRVALSENIPPSHRSSSSEVAKNSSRTRTLNLTPHAVKSVPQVMGEVVSRGPVAVLQDRTNHLHRDVQITPTRFAPAYEVGVGAMVVFDPSLPSSESNTPQSHSRGGIMFETVPAMAFLCSPNTTNRLISQQENEGYSSPTTSAENCSSSAMGKDRQQRSGIAENARRLSFSPQTRSADGRGTVVVEDVHDCSFDSYTQSPPPLVLSRRPHSLSASALRPVVLRL